MANMAKQTRIIVHNSVSLDGSLTNFEPNMGLHYKIAGDYRPDAHIIGSNTIKVGAEMYGEGDIKEEERDFKKPDRSKNYPYWVIPDTRGSLMGMLHTCRKFEYCRDVIVLISETTPEAYIRYLQERDYDYYITGKDHVNLKESVILLSERYQINTILADTGRILGNLLINQGLVSEISLLVHPDIVGNKAYPVFSEIDKSIKINLIKSEIPEKGFVWLVYKIE
jgi:2,5-diamino-6-(ribosylamino)-4(3H)-pyrimidinone 5'-phosphate reductase